MRTFVVGLGCLVVAVGALAFSLGGGGTGGTDALDPPPLPVSSDAAGVLYRVGLSAETLAASGVTAPQVAGMLAAALDQHDPATLMRLDEVHAHARAEESRLSALARSGLASSEDLAALASARASASQAETALTGYLDAIRAAACASITAEQGVVIQASNANRSWGLAPQYLVKSRPEPGWVALREALDTKRISEIYGYDFPQSAQNELVAVDREAEIALAKANLDANIFAVQTAWNQAASD